ncbi:kinase-like protein [Phycomyces blakesleeanus]|uniref:Kinase-like protein n=1 Tax=Phycomyces blakesleeanus TaxID=4837 RepID=A0ABR3APG6_PHYBL
MGALCCKQDPLDLGGEVDLSHFVLLRSVGKGAFGKVRVVQHKGTKQLFALKYINKTKCIGMRAVDNIISERRLLEKISYGLTVNMRYAFQDDENLFMVLDLMLGGDLRFHLDRLGTIPEASVQFYAAQVALSLNYLHSKRIIHRDLKPDNILLNENGHAHITDFNIAVRFQESKPLTSIAGSMAYMAPEILQKRGYFAAVDWWSLGVVCFELLFGKRPFRGKTNEALQNAIMYDPLRFPENHSISSHAIEFLKALMTRDPNSRLGYNEQGFARFKAHPWMQGMRWELLEHKQAVPPFVPDRKRANFDPTHELEEILLEENPLKVRKRSPKRSGSNINMSLKSHTSDANLPEMSPEWQRMEEKFLPFDFTKPVETLLQAEQRYRIQEQPSIRAQNEKHGSYVSSYSHQTAATNTTTTTATNTNPNNVTPYTANTANTGHNNNNNNSSNYYYNSNNNNHNNNHINHNNNPEDLSRKV